MFFLFLALWFVFHGKITAEIAIIGAVVSALMYGFCIKFLAYQPKNEWKVIKSLPQRTAYAMLMVREIALSNIALTKIVFSKNKPEPVLVTFHTPLEDVAARTVLCDSITLTPGTITVSIEDDCLTVHCLDKSFAEGIQNTPMQQALLQMTKGEK